MGFLHSLPGYYPQSAFFHSAMQNLSKMSALGHLYFIGMDDKVIDHWESTCLLVSLPSEVRGIGLNVQPLVTGLLPWLLVPSLSYPEA